MGRRERIREKILARCVETPGPLETPCQIWQGPTSGASGRGKDYPRMNLDGGTVAVHRAWFTNENGLIPPRKQLDHLCRIRLCVIHSEMVTHKKNQLRRDQARAAIICEGVASHG